MIGQWGEIKNDMAIKALDGTHIQLDKGLPVVIMVEFEGLPGDIWCVVSNSESLGMVVNKNDIRYLNVH